MNFNAKKARRNVKNENRANEHDLLIRQILTLIQHMSLLGETSIRYSLEFIPTKEVRRIIHILSNRGFETHSDVTTNYLYIFWD
jgi:hypothetical protein